ncbi:unnamed protein product, partial [Amoebophrya sp. A120]
TTQEQAGCKCPIDFNESSRHRYQARASETNDSVVCNIAGIFDHRARVGGAYFGPPPIRWLDCFSCARKISKKKNCVTVYGFICAAGDARQLHC